MKEIELKETDAVFLDKIDLLTANMPFYHVDRIAKLNVMIYVITGCIYVSEEDRDYEVGPGEMLLLKQGTHQFGKKMIEEGTSWIYAHFYVGGIENEELKKRTDLPENPGIQLPKMIGNLGKTDIPGRLKQLIKLSDNNLHVPRSKISSSFQNLLTDLYEQEKTHTSLGLVDEILEYLQKRVRHVLTSEEIEQQFHLTYKYLTRSFSEAYGVGIMQYHVQLKMQGAARELRSTGKTVAAIAEEFGFNDALYFSKCFRKQFGVSPREYRKNQMLAL